MSDHLPSSSSSSCRCGSRGQWVVVVLVLLGVAVGIAAVLYWSNEAQYQQHRAAQNRKEAAGSVPFDPTRAQAELERVRQTFATAMLQRDDLRPVLDAARRLVERYPRYAPVRAFYGQVLMKQGDFPAAYVQLQRSLELDARQADVEVLAGTVASALQKHVEAARHFANAVGLEPTNGLYRVALAQVYMDQQRFDEARDTLLEALRVNSSLHQAYKLLADLYARQNKLSLALTQIQKAIDLIGPDERRRQVIYLRDKAAILRRDNRPDEALLVLQNLRPEERNDPAVMEEMAACWAMTGRFDRAAELYEQAFAADPTDLNLLAGAARWRLRAGDQQAAQRHLEMLQRFDPQHPAINELLDQTGP